MTHAPQGDAAGPWYAGITRYQWLVLVIASLGWVFDVYEAAIFVASMEEIMPTLLPAGTPPGTISYYNNIIFGAFLLGGATGGVAFGMLSDRVGRTRTMVYTILMYSAFTGLSALAQTWWHLAILRFFVALGTGGEWAVASAMVAEVFPRRARAWSAAIFHGSSVFGTLLATAAGAFVVGNPALKSEEYPSLSWRVAFLLGVLPALLVVWIRISLREPPRLAASTAGAGHLARGSLTALFVGPLLRRTLVGVALASAGLATYWGVHVYAKNLTRNLAERDLLAPLQTVSAGGQESAISDAEKAALLKAHEVSLQRWSMLGMLLATLGGGAGLVSFGPLCERFGRRGTFLFYFLGGAGITLVLFRLLADASLGVMIVLLPVFGFLTIGMHAGFAVYFPELFPTRLRGTGAGFCFNVGRVLAAPILFISGWMQKDWGLSLADSVSILSGLYLVGAALLVFAPETHGQELPE